MKHSIMLMAALTTGLSIGLAQTTPVGEAKSATAQDKKIDELPTLLGGPTALAKALTYPAAARKDSVQGIVYVEATVDKEGNVTKAVVVKGVREDLDKASIEAVRSMKFTPGKHNGKPVEALVTIPISFKLK